MLTALILSQRQVSSSRTNRPCIPFGARCRGHVEMMWSAVCSEAPHSQFGEEAAPHLYMDEWNRPTPVRRRFSFTQDVLGKPIPRGLGLALGIKWPLMHFSSTPCSICNPSIALRECLIRSDYPVVSVQRVQTGVLI